MFQAGPSDDLKDLHSYTMSSPKMWAMLVQSKEFWTPFAREYGRWVAYASGNAAPDEALKRAIFYARAYKDEWNRLRDKLGNTSFVLIPRSLHSDKAKLTSFATRSGYIVQEGTPVSLPKDFTFVSSVWPIIGSVDGKKVFSSSLIQPGSLVEGKASSKDSQYIKSVKFSVFPSFLSLTKLASDTQWLRIASDMFWLRAPIGRKMECSF